MSDVKTQIDETVKANDVVLYMKGTKEMPQCGFSSRVAGVLNYMGVDYADVNVLADDAVRQGYQGLFRLADCTAALRQRRVCRWVRYHHRDDFVGRVGHSV